MSLLITLFVSFFLVVLSEIDGKSCDAFLQPFV